MSGLNIWFVGLAIVVIAIIGLVRKYNSFQGVYRHLRPVVNLISVFKYGIIFVLVIMLLPFTAFEWMVGHTMLAGLFVEHDALSIFL